MKTKKNKLALGAAQFGLDYGIANEVGQVSLKEVQSILAIAGECDINVLDTAISYGTSEEVLGKVGVDRFRVVTKLPSLPAGQSDTGRWVTDQVCESLKRLGQKRLYGLLLHRSEDVFGLRSRSLIHALSDLKENGLVEKVGVSIYSPEELEKVFEKINVDLVQAPLNVVDRRMEVSGWLKRLKDYGVEIHVRSAFLQGLLLMDRNKIPEKFSRWSSLWDEWHEKTNASGTSPLIASLAYPLSIAEVDQVLVGVNSAVQLLGILQAAGKTNRGPDTSFMCTTDLDLLNPSRWNHL